MNFEAARGKVILLLVFESLVVMPLFYFIPRWWHNVFGGRGMFTDTSILSHLPFDLSARIHNLVAPYAPKTWMDAWQYSFVAVFAGMMILMIGAGLFGDFVKSRTRRSPFPKRFGKTLRPTHKKRAQSTTRP